MFSFFFFNFLKILFTVREYCVASTYSSSLPVCQFSLSFYLPRGSSRLTSVIVLITIKHRTFLIKKMIIIYVSLCSSSIQRRNDKKRKRMLGIICVCQLTSIQSCFTSGSTNLQIVIRMKRSRLRFEQKETDRKK